MQIIRGSFIKIVQSLRSMRIFQGNLDKAKKKWPENPEMQKIVPKWERAAALIQKEANKPVDKTKKNKVESKSHLLMKRERRNGMIA